MKGDTYIGCSGFAQGYWKGFFYPEDLPAKEYLNYYSRYLNAVEINSTFYRKPILKTLEKWYESTGSDFKFFIKIPKAVTHNKKIKGNKRGNRFFLQPYFCWIERKTGRISFSTAAIFPLFAREFRICIANSQ